jgi:ubiquinol-cytochrome c reductase cytochrome c subunit
VSWINARRRRPAAGYAALLLGLVVVALAYGALTSSGGVSQASAAVGAQQDTAAGKRLFQANCSSCHGLEAQGTSQAAMLTGPEAMPVFADGAVSPQAKRDIIAYITQTRVEPNPGGFSLGRTGPITEGLVIFFGGLGFLILVALWITAKRRDPRPTGME